LLFNRSKCWATASSMRAYLYLRRSFCVNKLRTLKKPDQRSFISLPIELNSKIRWREMRPHRYVPYPVLKRNRMLFIYASGSSSTHMIDNTIIIRNNIITRESITVLYYMTESLNLKRISKRL
jgi:hypothetical protein